MEQSAEFRLHFSGELPGDTGTLSLIDHLQGRRKETLMFKTVCQQALHLGDFVKSTHARGTREEKRQRGTRQYPDLDSAFDCKSTTQIWVVTRHQYRISTLVSQTSFRRETDGGVTKCRLFSQATIHVYNYTNLE